MKFLDTSIDEGFGINYADPYPHGTEDSSMKSLFLKVIRTRYFTDYRENFFLGNRMLNANIFFRLYSEEKKKNSELLTDPERADKLFNEVVRHVSLQNISDFKVTLTLSESLIFRFGNGKYVVDLEVFFGEIDEDDDLEAILVFKNWNQEALKEYGKLEVILDRLSQIIDEENLMSDSFSTVSELSEETFVETTL